MLRGMNDPAIVLRPGAQLVLNIDDITSEGAGVGRVEGMVVFVPGALPGDSVRVQLNKLQKKFVEGRLLSIETPAPGRRPSPCPHQGTCGGCPLMPLDEGTALVHKAHHLAETIRRIGRLETPNPETIASPLALRYRGRVRFAVAPREHGALIGFHQRGRDNAMIAVGDCRIAPERASQLAQRVLDALDRQTRRGSQQWPTALELRGSLARHEWLAVIVSDTGPWSEAALAATQAMEGAPDLMGVVRVEVRDEKIARETLLAGRDNVMETIGGIDVELSATNFLQVNPPVAALMYQRAGEWLASEVPHLSRLLDLFCGPGLAGFLATKPEVETFGIDNHAGAIARAQRTAERAGRLKSRFVARDARAALRDMAQSGERFDAAIINPPRAGLGADLAPALATLQPRALVMMSCHPAALARDIAGLSAHGFTLTKLAAVDMFPQTAELETLALMVAHA